VNFNVKQKIDKKVLSLGELWWQTRDKQEGVKFGWTLMPNKVSVLGCSMDKFVN
jgi:hypothetical protein